MRTDGDRTILREILTEKLVEYQRLARDCIVTSETLHTCESITYDGEYIGRAVALIGKGCGGNYHVLDAIIITLFQRHGW